MTIKKLYGEISKTQELEDGTLMVEGIASTDGVDSDGEIITSTAMKAAIPDYMKFGAVREMHQPLAAGTAVNMETGDDGVTTIKAHIVDSEAVKKVKAGVYKGFSVGGKVTSRDELQKTTITGIKLVEVSLVDRPANPEAVITCYKAETVEEGGEPLKKSFYSVSCLADLVGSVQDFINYSEYENQYTGQNEEIPAMVLDAAKALGEALAQLVSNEIAALTTDKAETVDITEDAITKVLMKHGLIKTEPAPAAAVEEPADIQKLQSEMDSLKAEKTDLLALNEGLQKRVTELEALPAGTAARLLTVSKAEDHADAPAHELKPILKNDGSVDETATLIKSAFSKPIFI